MEKEPIVLNDYGVVLRQLTHDKIEIVRQWRNSPAIRETMFFQDEITPQMQEAWFKKINNNQNLFFIILFRGEEIGLINVKDIDYEKSTGETGVFIWDTRFLSTDVAYRAHLVMYDFVFGEMGLKETFSHIRADNSKAIRFTLFMGGVFEESKSTDTEKYYSLSSDGYLKNLNRQRFIYKWKKLKVK